MHFNGELADQGSGLISNYNYWHRTLRVPDALDIWRAPQEFTAGKNHVYYVQKNEPLASPYRPQCNLTRVCAGNDEIPQYETGDAERWIDGCLINRPSPSLEDISFINVKITNLKLFKNNPDSLAMLITLQSSKLELMHLVLDSLLELNQTGKIDSLLGMQDEIEYSAMRFELALRTQGITTAQQRLQEVATKDTLQLWTDYLWIQALNIEREIDITYRPSPADLEDIERISTQQDQVGGIARVLLCYWYDKVPYPIFVEDIPYAKSISTQVITELIQVNKRSEYSLQVKPNPGNGNYRITVHNFEDFRAMPLTLRIFDFTGKMIQHIEGIYSGTEFGLDLQSLPAGLYLVQLVHHDVPISLPVKLIKQ